MFAVVCIPNFSLQAFLRHEPELRDRPVALIEATGTNFAKTLILECTRTAETAGVCPGLTAPQAQARCRELVLKPRTVPAEQNATGILLQTAYAFSPNIEDTSPGVCTIDLRGLNFCGNRSDEIRSRKSEIVQNSSMPVVTNDHSAQQSFQFFQTTAGQELFAIDQNRSAISAWAGAIVAALQQLRLEAQVGIASTPNIALLAARAANPVLLVERATEFFDSLPFVALEPGPQVLNIVKRWGLCTAGAFLALGKEAIAERLGAEALEIFHRASTQTIRPLNIVRPLDTFDEQMDFEVQVETIEPLLFVLRRFVEQLATRIALTYRVVAELRLTLVLESGVRYERTFKIPAPTTNVETLFRMLHTHLENLRTDASVQSLCLSATPVKAEGQQFGLFESALRDPNHFHETLARLTALLGPDRVGTPVAEATHRPDAFQMKTPDFGAVVEIQNSKFQIQSHSGLCLRRFRSPIHAEVELEQGRPKFISTLMISARIKRARGPWCTSGTWWDQRRWARQEWDVETDKGEVYRVRNLDGDWVVEGVYD
jgi:protein ImuB